jgi:Fe-S-cluster containining protein
MNTNPYAHLTGIQKSMIAELGKALKKEIQKWKNPKEELKNFYESMNKDIEKGNLYNLSSCKKGCSFCCNINVDVSKPEAELLKEHIKPEDIPILRKQAVNPKEFSKLDYKDRKCIFLKNGECQVYDIRPISCRRYFVSSDPEKCNSEFENQEVIVLASTMLYLKADVFWSIYPTKNLASQLLNS